MKHYAKPKTIIEGSLAPKERVIDIPVSDINIDRLMEDGLLALYREMKNLLLLSTNGKLAPNDAKDLRDHVKLLFELKDRENDSLKGLTDDELEAQARAVLGDQD